MLFSALGSHHKASPALTRATRKQQLTPVEHCSPADGGGFALHPPKKESRGGKNHAGFLLPELA